MFALTDGVILGEIVRVERDRTPDDGHASTVVIAVKEWIKGRPRSDTIRVRVISGITGEYRTHSMNDFVRLQDFTMVYPRGLHLFFVSQPIWEGRSSWDRLLRL
jgi:hypothetical protein